MDYNRDLLSSAHSKWYRKNQAKDAKNRVEANFNPTEKQALAYLNLVNYENGISEVVFGGGAGAGKSMLGCTWVLIQCMQFSGVRYLVGRSKLSSLRQTTLNTLFDCMTEWGIKENLHYTYNQQANEIRFMNGSEIILKDLFYYPSDPNFDALGSLEITGAFIDEAGQITEKAKNIVMSRIRYKLNEYGLSPKMLMSCNPSKGWLYESFYAPFKTNTLESYRLFIQALVTDNPHISPFYIQNLERLDEISKRRLLYGEWEYEDSNNLVQYDKLLNLFDNTNKVDSSNEWFLSVDVARYGKDNTVIMLWNGLALRDIIYLNGSNTKETADLILKILNDYKIPQKNLVIDSDGVGGGVADHFKSCINFINNSRPINGDNFKNLKTQCYFKLAEYINEGWLSLEYRFDDIDIRSKLMKELEYIIQDNIDNDGKLSILSKDKVKKILGRSPDFSDAMMLRMYYELNDKKKGTGFIKVMSSHIRPNNQWTNNSILR